MFSIYVLLKASTLPHPHPVRFFQTLFAQTTDKHPIVILKAVPHAELKALLEYMYRGEVNVVQDQLGPLIKTAESLKIKGLADGGSKPPDTDSRLSHPAGISSGLELPKIEDSHAEAPAGASRPG